MGPYQRTPKKVTRAIKYPGLGVRSVGPVGDFLELIRAYQSLWSKHYRQTYLKASYIGMMIWCFYPKLLNVSSLYTYETVTIGSMHGISTHMRLIFYSKCREIYRSSQGCYG